VSAVYAFSLPLPRKVMFSSLSICLLATLRNNFRMYLWEIFRECLQWANEQMIFIWVAIRITVWINGLFPYLSLLGDMESGINRLHCAKLHCRACTSRHCHSNYDVIMSLAHDRRVLVEVCTVAVLVVMATLWNTACHFIFALWFRSSSSLFFLA